MNLIELLGLKDDNDELIALLVLKGRHALIKTLLTNSYQPYNPVYTIIALENNHIDIVYLL